MGVEFHSSLSASVGVVEVAIQSAIPVAAGNPMVVATVVSASISDPESLVAIPPCYCQMTGVAKAHGCSVAG